jgi:hypothetical protein
VNRIEQDLSSIMEMTSSMSFDLLASGFEYPEMLIQELPGEAPINTSVAETVDFSFPDYGGDM